MNAKLTNILLLLILTAAVVIGSGCGVTRAQGRQEGKQNSTVEISESSKPAYKPEKRISRDIISKGDTTKIEKSAKSKKR